MESGVLDSFALLAIIFREVGSEVVLPIVFNSVISAVNAAEVQARIVRVGGDTETAWELTSGGIGQIVSFDGIQAKLCGSLINQTKSVGLSAGDRACLALALTLGLPVYTADRIWAKVNVGVDIRLIR